MGQTYQIPFLPGHEMGSVQGGAVGRAGRLHVGRGGLLGHASRCLPGVADAVQISSFLIRNCLK